MATETTSRRDHLVETAACLFARHGFHAVGIDRVLAEAGVAKMTLYKHFKSKDELIAAALASRHDQWQQGFIGQAKKAGDRPGGCMLAIFDILAEYLAAPEFCGCLFIHAVAEFGDEAHPAHVVAVTHKQELMTFFLEQAHAGGADDPEHLAEALCLLVDGTLTLSHVTGRIEVADHAIRAAATLIEHAGVSV